MSDLYLILRRRLDEVRNWVAIPTDVLKAARKRKGWSYEIAARHLHVSSKSYERYEKAGRVPVDLVDSLVQAFELEVERPQRVRVPLATITGGERDLDTIETSLRSALDALEAYRAAHEVVAAAGED